MKKKIIIGVSVVVLIVVGFLLQPKNEVYPSEKKKQRDEVDSTSILVQINGEVLRPGIYEVSSTSRVHDVVVLAGGFTPYADSNMNLVQKVTDGMVITVLRSEGAVSSKISINKASVEELMTLKGIGASKAEQIVAYRTQNGRFTQLEDLMKVSGISQGIYDGIKDLITL